MEQTVNVMWMSMQSLAAQAGIWLPKVILALAFGLGGRDAARTLIERGLNTRADKGQLS